MGRKIGIDIINNKCRAAAMEGTGPELIPSSDGKHAIIPKVACYRDGKRVVGYVGDSQEDGVGMCVISGNVSHIGKGEVYQVYNQAFSIEEIEATIVRSLKSDAEEYLNDDIDGGIFAVPVAYDFRRRMAIRTIAAMADISYCRIINDTTAVAVSRYFRDLKTEEKCMVIICAEDHISISSFELGDGIVELLSSAGVLQVGKGLCGDIIGQLCNEVLTVAEIGTTSIRHWYVLADTDRKDQVTDAILRLDSNALIHQVRDSSIATGCALQAGKLEGNSACDEILLFEATTKDVFLETEGGVLTNIVPKNTIIPTRQSQNFTTAADNQAAIDIHLKQGDGASDPECISLGRFRLDGLPQAPKGEVEVELTVDIDAAGIIQATVKEPMSGTQKTYSCDTLFRIPQNDLDNVRQRIKGYTCKCGALLKNNTFHELPKPDKKEQNRNGNNEIDDFNAIVKEMLISFDSLFYGISQMDEAEKQTGAGQGMVAVLNQMLDSLNKMGITAVVSDGLFDPTIHEAIDHIIDSSYPENYIVKEVRKGFFLNGKLLRASQVIVAN